MERKVEGDETEEDMNSGADERGDGSLTTTSLISTTTSVTIATTIITVV